MKKKELRNGSKIVSIVCVVAMLITVICQFVPYWSYTGIAENKEISEERAQEMTSSIAGYCWIPNSNESDALEEYVKDPTKYYAEEVETVEYDEEELEAVKGAVAALEEEPVDDEAAEDTDSADADAAATENTEEAAEGEEATEEAAEEPAEEEAVPADGGDVVVTKGMLVTIKQYTKAAEDITEVDKLAKKEYGTLDKTKLVNTLTFMPVIALVLSLLGILLAIYKFKKVYIPALATIIVGAYNLMTYTSQVFLKLSDKWSMFVWIAAIVMVVGIVMVAYDFRAGLKEKKAKNAEAALQETVEA